MPIVAQSPVAAVFGPEVADDISKNKSLLKQCTEALTLNGIAVALPPSFLQPGIVAGGPNYSGTPYDIELAWVKSLQTAMATGTHAVGYMLATIGNALKLTAKLAGAPGALVSVKVESGTMSGAKITITDGTTPEVYDNVATSPLSGVASAIAGSALVTAVVVGTGDIVVMPTTNLAVGVPVIAPTFALGENDNQSIFIAKWGKALFDALRTAGYIA